MELTNHGGSHDIICHYINALVYHGLYVQMQIFIIA